MTDQAQTAKAAPTKARVILDHGKHKINDIVKGAAAEEGVAAGWADDSEGAVVYAEKEARKAARAAADDE